LLLDLADPVHRQGMGGEYQALRRTRSYSEIMTVYRGDR